MNRTGAKSQLGRVHEGLFSAAYHIPMDGAVNIEPIIPASSATATMMMILVDTSVYISALADNEIEKLLKEARKKVFIISSEVVEREIDKASFYLQKRGNRKDSERLKEIYNSAIGGTIKLTERVISIFDKYSAEVRIKFGKDKANEMEDDFRIVASASIAGLKHISTFNRKTMSNEKIVPVYERINQSNKLKTPKFIKTKEDLSKLLSSL